MARTLKELIDTLPQVGQVTWMGLRPARKAPMDSVQSVEASTEVGLVGDRYSGRDGARHVTLLQAEHLPVLASILQVDSVPPELLRRNIIVKGINLLSLKNKHIAIGSAVLEVTGLCHPCSRMETLLGDGGYNAVRGHGGITARVITSGVINMGDSIRYSPITTV